MLQVRLFYYTTKKPLLWGERRGSKGVKPYSSSRSAALVWVPWAKVVVTLVFPLIAVMDSMGWLRMIGAFPMIFAGAKRASRILATSPWGRSSKPAPAVTFKTAFQTVGVSVF